MVQKFERVRNLSRSASRGGVCFWRCKCCRSADWSGDWRRESLWKKKMEEERKRDNAFICLISNFEMCLKLVKSKGRFALINVCSRVSYSIERANYPVFSFVASISLTKKIGAIHSCILNQTVQNTEKKIWVNKRENKRG